MLGALLLSVVLATSQGPHGSQVDDPAPGDGLSLLPDPPSTSVAPATTPTPLRLPGRPAEAGVLAGAAATGAWKRRRHRMQAAPLTEDMVVVFIGGYGSQAEQPAFQALIDLLQLRPSQVQRFDYRWAEPTEDHAWAARRAEVGELAAALQGYLRGAALGGRSIYLVGHSLGGATLAELVARWDDYPSLRIPQVRGVALLDPPIAHGLLGSLQSGPRLFGWRPHDGGYDPTEWSWWTGWDDQRVDLGGTSQVPVVVFRNPKAAITNFWDRPKGLRVFDVPDAGPHPFVFLAPPLATLPWRLGHFLKRLAEAHVSVLGDPRVAQCISKEIRRGGSCTRIGSNANTSGP